MADEEEPVPVEETPEEAAEGEAPAEEGEAPAEGDGEAPAEAEADAELAEDIPAEDVGEAPAVEGDEPPPAGDEAEEVAGDLAGESAELPPAEDNEEAPAFAEEASMEEPLSPEGEGEGRESPDQLMEQDMSPTSADARPGDDDEEALGLESDRGSPTDMAGAFPEGGVDSAMMGSDSPSPSGRLDDEGEDLAEFGEDDYEEDKVDPMQELQEKYDQLLELNERAMATNVALQRRVIQRKAQDKPYDASEKQSEGKVTEHKYQNVLLNVHSVRLKLRLQQVKAARMSEELKNQLEAKRQKAIECRDSFQEFKRQVARHAEYARTGKKIPEKIIQEVEEFELDKDAEVEEVRGSNISLKNRLSKLEQALRKKDELAENLHVIDFEQLKIENQTLNEKIEERNEELHKLRKKTIVTVQIITHMREKVQFVQQEYLALKNELAQLDLDLAAQRDTVTKTKHERDDIRSENAKYRQQTGITNSEGLSKDYEERAEHVKSLIQDISNLKNRHKQMIQFVKRHGGKV